MSLRVITASAIIDIMALATVATAPAAGRSYSLSVVPQANFVSPGENVVVSYTATNNTSEAATCYIHVEEINFDIPLGTIGANQSAGGQLSTPASGGKNAKLTFDLYCDGNHVASRSVNVKVR